MVEKKIIKKFKQLTKDELRERHNKRRGNKPKSGSYSWDTEEERASKGYNNAGRIPTTE
jgi:hypothetical protein